MEIRHLRTFCKVAEMNNFTKAAEALHYTEAAVSQQVRALEKELGVKLFERGARSVSLTPAGRRLYDYARRIVTLHQEAIQSMSKVPVELLGEVRIAASTIPGEHLLPPLLAAFRQQHPQVRLITIVSDSVVALSEMRRNQADLGAVGLKPTSPKLDFRQWCKDELILVVPPKHRFARRGNISLDELRGEPFIVRERGSGTRQCLEQSLEQAGLSLNDLNVTLELGSTEAVKEAVMSGAGVAVVSRLAVERELKRRQLKQVTVHGLKIERHFYLVTNKRRVLSPAAQALLDFLGRSQPIGNR